MMCPPFCFFMPAASRTAGYPSPAILRRVSPSCSEKVSIVPESAEHGVLWASCQRCGVTARPSHFPQPFRREIGLSSSDYRRQR